MSSTVLDSNENVTEGGHLLSGEGGNKIQIVPPDVNCEKSLEDKRSRAVFRQVSNERKIF